MKKHLINLNIVSMLIANAQARVQAKSLIEEGHSIPLHLQKIITCCGVYNNGDKVFNGVYEEDLPFHIQYNKDFRFGRALFVEGKCVHKGYLTQERCDAIEVEIKDKKLDKNTRPYS